MTKTETELQQIKSEIAFLTEKTTGNATNIDDVWSDLEKTDELIDKLRDQLAAQQTQIAVVATTLEDLKKRWDESDRRRWTVYGVALAATLTFAANLVLLFLKR